MQEPLSSDLFYHNDQNMICFEKNINIELGIYPIRKTWVPFFEQMSQQLTQLIKKDVNKNFLRKFDYFLLHEDVMYKGTPYKIINSIGWEWTQVYSCGLPKSDRVEI